jgi:hypothetical protein
MKFKYFTMQKYNLKKKSSKRNQKSFEINSITDLKFQHKPKYHLSKILIKNQGLPRGQNPLSYYILYNESKHNNILALVGKSKKRKIQLPNTLYFIVDKKNGCLDSFIYFKSFNFLPLENLKLLIGKLRI